MENLKVKFQKLVEHAFTPEYSTDGAAGLDLRATDYSEDHDHKLHEYGTGIAVEIPKGYVGKVYARSSVSKTGLMLANNTGIIDCDYRGEIILKFKEVSDDPRLYGVGEKIGQLVIVPIPKVQLEESKELSNTQRGSGGFGSTGK